MHTHVHTLTTQCHKKAQQFPSAIQVPPLLQMVTTDLRFPTPACLVMDIIPNDRVGYTSSVGCSNGKDKLRLPSLC